MEHRKLEGFQPDMSFIYEALREQMLQQMETAQTAESQERERTRHAEEEERTRTAQEAMMRALFGEWKGEKEDERREEQAD
jgi:hypothetical protein